MKALRIYLILIVGACISIISSCKNQDIEFDNYSYSAVYFAPTNTNVRYMLLSVESIAIPRRWKLVLRSTTVFVIIYFMMLITQNL